MERKFTDYHGPTGPYIATERGILPLSSSAGMSAAMDSAMLVSLGNTEKAAEYQRQIERRSESKPSPRHTTGQLSRSKIRAAIKASRETLRRLSR